MDFKNKNAIINDLHGVDVSHTGNAMKMRIDALGRACATGKRKTSIAKVILDTRKSKGITINGKELHAYFEAHHACVIERSLAKVERGHINISTSGGGKHGQCEAVCHGIACVMYIMFPHKRNEISITRDSRKKERKCPGYVSARGVQQFSKR